MSSALRYSGNDITWRSGSDVFSQSGLAKTDPEGLKMGPKTAEALRAHGVETLGELAALTASQQQELLASVPRTIVSQLK